MNIAFLKKIDLFSGLDHDDIVELSTYFKTHVVSANKVIFWMEEKGDCLYILQSGEVEISYNDDNGKEMRLAVLGNGSFFGDLALIDGGTHTATARSLTDCTLLTLDQHSFYLFLEKHPKLSHNMLNVLTERLRNSTVKLRGVLNANEEIAAKNSTFQQFVDRMANGIASGYFLTFSITCIIIWVIMQINHYNHYHRTAISFEDKPPAFDILANLLTLTSFLLTILILNSQRRQAENDRIRGEIEYQVNLKSQTEIVKLQRKMDELIEKINELEKKDH